MEENSIFDIKLVAFDIELYYSWKEYFDDIENVEIIDGDILQLRGDAIVSPANSFGYMDGGLDLKYSQHFGWEIESLVRDNLESEFFGEIPVGNALISSINHSNVTYLITAPTMRVPSDVSNTVNAYLAFKGILQTVMKFNLSNSKKITSVLCPGLGTGEGKLTPKKCAKQMYRAYQVCFRQDYLTKGGLARAVDDHIDLLYD